MKINIVYATILGTSQMVAEELDEERRGKVHAKGLALAHLWAISNQVVLDLWRFL